MKKLFVKKISSMCSKGRAALICHLFHKGPASLVNIRLAQQNLLRTNCLGYFFASRGTKKKCFNKNDDRSQSAQALSGAIPKYGLAQQPQQPQQPQRAGSVQVSIS
jgi:hypothetical protein